MVVRFTSKGFLVWGICALFFLYEFMLRIVVGTFQEPIMRDLELSSFKFSLISATMYLVVYGIMQIPVGFIVDNFGLKRTLLFASVVCAASVVGFAFCDNFLTAVVFRLLTGFGSSFGFVCLLVSVYDWMPKKNIAFLIGLSQFVGTLGPMAAAGPMESLASNPEMNWRYVFIILGFSGFLITALILFFVENNRGRIGVYRVLKRPESIAVRIKKLFVRIQPWYVAIFTALVYFTIEYLSENEGKLYLSLKGYSMRYASMLLSLSWVGYAIGCPLFGFLSDYFQRRKPFMMLSAIITVLSVVCFVFFNNSTLLIIAFLMLGFGASGQSLGYVTIAEMYKERYIPMALSLNNAMLTTFASINAPVLGLIIDYSRSGESAQLGDYTIAFYCLMGFVALSVLFPLFLIKETYCKSQAEFTILNPGKT